MGVSYDLFAGAFLSKVTEYDFIRLDTYDRNSIIDGFMKRACAQFNKICKYDIVSGDDHSFPVLPPPEHRSSCR